MRYHKTHLTRRLILETSADSEKEENMVEWLRVCGGPYLVQLSREYCMQCYSEPPPFLSPSPSSLSPSLSFSTQDVGMPAEYVNKLARMFQDVKVSEDLNQEFKDRHRGSQVAGGKRKYGWVGIAGVFMFYPPTPHPPYPDMVNLKVLNAGAWSRSSERVPVSLPTEVALTVPPFCFIVQLQNSLPLLTFLHPPRLSPPS